MTVPDLPAGLGPVSTAQPLSGGHVSRIWQARLADGREVIVKRTPGVEAELEAEGLDALAAAGAETPQVLAADAEILVLEHVRGQGEPAALGRTLAMVHRSTADRFGWHRDNVIGPLPQRNDQSEDWPSFFVQHRVADHLADPAVPSSLRARLEAACDGPLQALLAHDPAPSLIHGDLWSGNVVGSRWLIDPAVHHADRELELAFMALFGGFPSLVWEAYSEAWPLDDGWERRRPALQLHHLLVHVRLFGGSYVGAVAARLDQLGM